MVSRTVLAVAIAVWTLLSWGGRIRLLTESEQDISNWVRIGGSLFVGALAVVALLAFEGDLEKWILTSFAVWSAVLWVRSLISVWAGSESIAFKLVHTVLAIGFFVLTYFAFRVGWTEDPAT